MWRMAWRGVEGGGAARAILGARDIPPGCEPVSSSFSLWSSFPSFFFFSYLNSRYSFLCRVYRCYVVACPTFISPACHVVQKAPSRWKRAEEKSSDGVRFEKLNADYGNCFCFELGKEVDSRRDADERKSANFGLGRRSQKLERRSCCCICVMNKVNLRAKIIDFPPRYFVVIFHRLLPFFVVVGWLVCV
jgi:hypothetical protein